MASPHESLLFLALARQVAGLRRSVASMLAAQRDATDAAAAAPAPLEPEVVGLPLYAPVRRPAPAAVEPAPAPGPALQPAVPHPDALPAVAAAPAPAFPIVLPASRPVPVPVAGPPGPRGPMPRHQWRDTRVRFEELDGTWGKWVELRGGKGKDAPPVILGGGGGGTNLATLRAASDAVPDAFVVRQGGNWVRASYAQMAAWLGGGGTPADAVTVGGIVVTVNGETVTVN